MDEVLKRIDRHMARGNKHMARGNELMARGNQLMEEVREEFRLNREAFELYKLAMAHLIEENRDYMREMRDQLRADSRAHTEAIFRMIERLDRFDSGPATA